MYERSFTLYVGTLSNIHILIKYTTLMIQTENDLPYDRSKNILKFVFQNLCYMTCIICIYSKEEVPHVSMISTSLELCQYKSMSFPSCFKNLTSISIDVDFDKITSWYLSIWKCLWLFGVILLHNVRQECPKGRLYFGSLF